MVQIYTHTQDSEKSHSTLTTYFLPERFLRMYIKIISFTTKWQAHPNAYLNGSSTDQVEIKCIKVSSFTI